MKIRVFDDEKERENEEAKWKMDWWMRNPQGSPPPAPEYGVRYLKEIEIEEGK